MIKPLRGYVLVEQLDDELTTSDGYRLPETTKDKPIKGTVLEIGDILQFDGDMIIFKDGVTLLNHYGDLKGKKVVYKRWSTTDLEEDGKKLSFVAFQDILGVYE